VYGWDFVGKGADISKCVKNCEEAEKSEFAKDCRNKGGLFKCCVTWSDLFLYVIARKYLKEKKLISNYEEVCNLENKTTAMESCRLCFAFHTCSVKDPSQLITLYHKTPDTDLNLLRGETIMNPNRYKIFSPTDGYLRLGVRAKYCLNLDTCLSQTTVYRSQIEYFRADNSAAFCKLVKRNETAANITANATGVYIPVETEEECNNRENINIRVCPKPMFLEKEPIAGGTNVTLYQAGRNGDSVERRYPRRIRPQGI